MIWIGGFEAALGDVAELRNLIALFDEIHILGWRSNGAEIEAIAGDHRLPNMA